MMLYILLCFFFFFSSRRRHTRFDCDWSSDVCSSDLGFNIKLVKCGGLTPALRMARHGRALGVKTMVGCMLETSALIAAGAVVADRKSTRLNSSHSQISYAVFCLKKKKTRRDLQLEAG